MVDIKLGEFKIETQSSEETIELLNFLEQQFFTFPRKAFLNKFYFFIENGKNLYHTQTKKFFDRQDTYELITLEELGLGNSKVIKEW